MKKISSFKFGDFSVKQRKLLNWWRESSPYHEYDIMIADGAIRSGKTIACICSFLAFVMTTYKNENFIIAGKTIGALKRNVIKPMLQIATAWGWKYNYNRSENYIEIGTNTFYMFDAHNESSQDKVQGLTAAGALLDEVALMPKSFIEQVIARTSVEGSKVFMNCNPESPKHYVKVELIDCAKDKKIYHLHFTMDDNLTLSEKIKDKYKRMYTGVFFKRFILGLWAIADGLIYQQFADYEEKFTISDEGLKDKKIMYATIGVDFGGNKSAHSFTLNGFTEGYKEIITIDEYYCDKRINPETLTNDFIDFVKRCQSKYKVYEAYCDSAEQALICGFESAVIKQNVCIDVKNAIKGPINDRISFYNSLMAQGRYKIHERCVNTRSALSSAVYDDKQPVKDKRLDDGTTNIDSLDSLEYSTESIQADILYLR